MCSKMSTRLSIIWEADAKVMGMTKPTCVIPWTWTSGIHVTVPPKDGSSHFPLYHLSVSSTLTHSCEAWHLTKAVSRILNGFNSRCLYVITGEEYRVTAVSPAYNLLLSVRQRRLRYLGHLLRLPHDSVVRRTLIAMAGGGNRYPEGSIFMNGQGSELKYLETLAMNHPA